MLADHHYLDSQYRLPETVHQYGKNIHLVEDPYLFTLVAKLGSPQCFQPEVGQLMQDLYAGLMSYIINNEFPKIKATIETRMSAMHPEGKFQAAVLDPNVTAVCVSLARAGIIPSQVCYEILTKMLNPEGVRQDHISINRKVDEKEHVIGTLLSGYKIGGQVDNAFLLIPDPMGATGSTLKTTFEIYKKYGRPKKIIALHLIVTPEYLSSVLSSCPDLLVYALRLDRGLSAPEILKTPLGSQWQKEKGLNAKDYIVPGAGGIGEVLNNAFV